MQFWSKFIKKVGVDYPFKKLVFNRIFNLFVKLIILSITTTLLTLLKFIGKTLIELFPLFENFNIFQNTTKINKKKL